MKIRLGPFSERLGWVILSRFAFPYRIEGDISVYGSQWYKICAAFLGLVVATATAQQQIPSVAEHKPPPDGTWTADAVIDRASLSTDTKLGAGQGVAVRDDKVYAYGDVGSANPRVGLIREYDLDLKPTGREIWLRKGGQPLILHPTGLTWDARFGTFLGDTVNKKARIYHLDWERAWRDGNLDAAVLDILEDDAAVNGCRPEFVNLEGRTFLATADYGDIRPEIRLLDPESLLRAGRTSSPGVVVHRILSGAWNQNLSWNRESGQLTCVENVIEGRGWRLDTIDLAQAVRDGRTDGPGVRVRSVTFDPHDELEGFCRLDRNRDLFITSSRSNNLLTGVIRRVEPHQTPPSTSP
jgi:hypothetical protein